MKVNIYITEEVSDQDRKQISELLGVKQATRDQLKEFLWLHGQNWRSALAPMSPGAAMAEEQQKAESDESELASLI